MAVAIGLAVAVPLELGLAAMLLARPPRTRTITVERETVRVERVEVLVARKAPIDLAARGCGADA